MPITRPIPPEAWPVVEVLRRDVPRPEPTDFVPVGQSSDPYLLPPVLRVFRHSRFPAAVLRGCCPMGIHPKATDPTPTTPRHFPVGPDASAIGFFATWWDAQVDPVAAVSATWDWPLGAPGPA